MYLKEHIECDYRKSQVLNDDNTKNQRLIINTDPRTTRKIYKLRQKTTVQKSRSFKALL